MATLTRPPCRRLLIAAAGLLSLGTAQAALTLNVTQDVWQGGFCSRISISNDSTQRSGAWVARFDLPRGQLTSSWNGQFTPNGTGYSVT
ncbi:hypothetical protein DBR42_15490, partial [Pelomonas sp. HMWF004]